jgi:hypothetical protein
MLIVISSGSPFHRQVAQASITTVLRGPAPSADGPSLESFFRSQESGCPILDPLLVKGGKAQWQKAKNLPSDHDSIPKSILD